MTRLTTPRLALRPVLQRDETAMAAVFTDPEVMRFSMTGALPRELVRAWVLGRARDSRSRFGHRAVVVRASGTVIGYAGLTREPGRTRSEEAELGFRLARAWWGRGYATEAARALVAHGLGLRQVRRVVAVVDPANAASVRVLEKAGLRFRREIDFEGYDRPDHLYAIERRLTGRRG